MSSMTTIGPNGPHDGSYDPGEKLFSLECLLTLAQMLYFIKISYITVFYCDSGISCQDIKIIIELTRVP